jgi:hypothetical protein
MSEPAAAASSELGRRELGFARVAVAIATAWYAAAALWGFTGPFGAGHVASSAAVTMAGENMKRWGILAPVTHYTFDAPGSIEYYCHHPWEVFWAAAVPASLFGHYDWVCRLPPILLGCSIPPLLFAVGRRVWGTVAGAVAACSFSVVPIALAFSNFNNLEIPVMFGALVMTWGYVRFADGWRRRWMAVSIGGLVFAANADWPAFVFAGTVLGFMLVRGLFTRGFFLPVDVRRFAQWWALSSSCAVLVLVFYVAVFAHAGKLSELFMQGELRSFGAQLPLGDVLESRRDWIDLSFTPLGVALGKLALPVILLRLFAFRRDLEVFGLAVLVMAAVQYVAFKQGADIHFFWSHYFALYFAFAMGALAASTLDFIGYVRRHPGRAREWRWAPLGTLLGFLALLASMLPDAVRVLVYGRGTGLRFDERGFLIHQDVDKTAALRFFAERFGERDALLVDHSMKHSWSIEWAVARPATVGSPPARPERGELRHYAGDARFLGRGVLSRLASTFQPDVVGPFWLVDRARPPGPLHGYALVHREPGPWQWFWSHGTDPVYAIEPDRFMTWELRHHFDQQPNPAPKLVAETLEQLRVAHNIAVAAGDAVRAAELEKRLLGALGKPESARLPEGHILLGSHLSAGVAPTLTVMIKAAGPAPHGGAFMIESLVERAPEWSWLPAARRARAVGMPFALPATLWKPGFVYSSLSEIRARPGKERFYGYWQRRAISAAPTGPRPVPPPRTIDLLVLD